MPTELPTERARPSVTKIVLTVVVVGLVAMWAYVLYLAFGPGRQPPLDRLEDPAFAIAAEDRCAAARREVGALPLATETETPAARADVIERANAVFEGMLADLESRIPSGDDRIYVERWLDDWALYLEDRERYVDALRADPEARFLVSEKPGEGRHVTGWIDQFAAANRMPSCSTPPDV